MAMKAIDLVREISNNLSEDEHMNDISSGTTNASALVILSMLNMSLKRAILAYDWSVLHRAARINLYEQDYDINNLIGFNGLVTDCLYNVSKNKRVESITPNEYIMNNPNNPSTYKENTYCLFNNALHVSHDLVGDEVVFMYRTNAAVHREHLGPDYTFMNNSDYCDLDDGLLIRGGIMYYSKSKMDEDWSQDVLEYETYLKQLIARQEPQKEIFAG